jgi:hypothetical protein
VEVDPGALGAGELARRLRVGDPALYARVRRGRLVLEVRTLTDHEAREAAGLVARALADG